MKNDPKEMISKFPGTCSTCKQAIKKGEPIIYWPLDKTAEHAKCGEKSLKAFYESAQDESFYNSQY